MNDGTRRDYLSAWLVFGVIVGVCFAAALLGGCGTIKGFADDVGAMAEATRAAMASDDND